MKSTRNLITAAAAFGLSASALAVVLANPGEVQQPSGRAAMTAQVADKKAESLLQMSTGAVKSVDTAKQTVTLVDGRVLQLHAKTVVFKGAEKGSIYAVSAGQTIEFALDLGADKELNKEVRKSVDALKAERLDAVGKGASQSASIALLRIKVKAEKAR